MDRTQKEEQVASLKQTFEDSEIVVVTHYIGMTMPEMTDLRSRMREAGASFKVTKNRLTRLALQDTDFESLTDLMTGPTALAYSADPVAAAKTAVNYAKDNEKLVILGGVFNGQELDVDGVKSLAKLPSMDELRGKLVGMISTPATRIAGVLQAPAGQVARVIGAYGAKGDEAA
ncbi:MAG: 50S ribosomal protein L10 [Rhodospirillaceae bacterium]|nr:50S ribosomal protein L10 [Rhodospirillaceae bacterium]MBT7268079.1 50S ribosomal protein L10 [Rhodospirillaceae bacterium]